MKETLPDHQRISEHLAVERTFLAWVRTAIAVISLGFVVAKSSLWLRDLAARLDPEQEMQSIGISLHLGIGMMAFGSIILILAAWHCCIVHRAIERGEVRPAHGMVVGVTTGVVLLAILMIVYIMLAAKGF